MAKSKALEACLRCVGNDLFRSIPESSPMCCKSLLKGEHLGIVTDIEVQKCSDGCFICCDCGFSGSGMRTVS